MIQARLARGKAECRVIVRRSDEVGAVVLTLSPLPLLMHIINH